MLLFLLGLSVYLEIFIIDNIVEIGFLILFVINIINGLFIFYSLSYNGFIVVLIFSFFFIFYIFISKVVY